MKAELNARFAKRVSHALEWGAEENNSRDYVQYISGLTTGLEDALEIVNEYMSRPQTQAKVETAKNVYISALLMAAEVCDLWNNDPEKHGELDLEYYYYSGIDTRNVSCKYFLPEGKSFSNDMKVYSFDHLEKPDNMSNLIQFVRTGNIPGMTIKGVD